MKLNYDDDAAIHPTGDAPEWRESFYCNFFDTESRYFGTAWQGVRPNQERAEAVFLLFDGDTPLIQAVDTNYHVPPDIGAERRAIANQRFECVEPWSHWTIHYDDGSARVDIDWQQISEVCDWDSDEDAPDPDKKFLGSAKHFEAAGTVSVAAEVDGRSIAFTGFGERDRAWGPRNYGLLAFSWWQTVQFPDGDAAHVWAMHNPGDKLRLYGFLHRDGVSRPAAFYDCEIGYDGENGPPNATKQKLVDDQGRELLIGSMELMQVLAFATQADGANLEVGNAKSEEEKPYYWTWQKFVRDDGVVGHGMIDLNFWRGNQYPSFTADVPAGTLYDYGLNREQASAP
jgi:hypothetical protein